MTGSIRIHADFQERVVVHPSQYSWVPSPINGVDRMMLDRIGAEVARATSIVRYAPNSAFTSHIHGGGEEFYVLDGTFADEHGEYPAGTYVRNPVNTFHTPRVGPEGATIFVKLHQFDENDKKRVVVNRNVAQWRQGMVEGLNVLPLHEFEGEHVALVKWDPNTVFSSHHHWGGEEILVLEGTFYDEHGEYPAGSWLRNPHQSRHEPYTKEDGALIYVKTGHLFGL